MTKNRSEIPIIRAYKPYDNFLGAPSTQTQTQKPNFKTLHNKQDIKSASWDDMNTKPKASHKEYKLVFKKPSRPANPKK